MRGQNSTAPIVVGVDGSAADHGAVEWAVWEASATQRPLDIVRVLDGKRRRTPSDQTCVEVTGRADEAPGATVNTALARAAVRARALAPDLEITSTAVVGAAVPALLRRAEGAELLVVGGREGPQKGSVSLAVAARAHCPVVVVSPGKVKGSPGAPDAATDPAPGRVVVASDGSELSAVATRFAFQAAARRRVGLTVVRAWTPPLTGYPRLVLGLDQLVRAERHKLLAVLNADRHDFPQVEVELKLVRGKHDHHGRTLIEESASATLVVLASHGHAGLAGRLSEAVCQSVLEHACCPVAVVKADPTGGSLPADAGAARTGSTYVNGATPSEVG